MRTELTITASTNRSPRIDADGALAGRLTAPDTVHIIGTAATPLGGDELEIVVRVLPGARLAVRSVAASIALPSAHRPDSHATWTFFVEEGGSLVFEPEPMIVGSTATHSSDVRIHLAPDASARVTEKVQIGRHGEALGTWVGSLHGDVDGRSVLRHSISLGATSANHDALSRPLAMMSSFCYPDSRSAALDGTGAGVRLPLAGGGSLSTWSGRRLDPHALLFSS